jgi:hypothetical protein
VIYLLCGVPGSGKSWVIDQLSATELYFIVIRHDDHDRRTLLNKATRYGNSPVIIDCPFDERTLKQELEYMGCKVTPIFIVEDPEVVYERYVAREGKPPAQNIITRAGTIVHKAREWCAFSGVSGEVLKHLKELLI